MLRIYLPLSTNFKLCSDGPIGNCVDTWTFVTRFETNLTYLNLTKPNLIDAPDLPTLVNGFETNLTYLNLT